MQVIVKGSSAILHLLQRKTTASIPARISCYVLRSETDDGTLLCNTLTGEAVLLSSEEKAALDKRPSMAEPVLSDLISHRFVVPEECAEFETVEQVRSLLLKKQEIKNKINRFCILPTTYCNARCFYCFESGIQHVIMTLETADRLVDYIEEHQGKGTVHFEWFGGEPTLGRNIIDHICGKLTERNVMFESTMVSNAYLFDAGLVNHAKEFWKMRSIQITLDGTEEIYNRTKAYVNVSGSPYQRVMRNIGLFLDAEIHVNIRLNMDSHNSENLKILIEELHERFGCKKELFVYVRQLNEGDGFDPIRHRQEDMEFLKRQLTDLQELLGKRGWNQFSAAKIPMLRITSCMADDPCCVLCTPDGILSKCEDQIYNHTVGTLEQGITNRDQVLWWRQRKSYDGCAECPLYPSCTRLLKHCFMNCKCSEHERKKMMDGIRDLMLHEYENWKETGKESRANEIQDKAGRADH